MFGAVVGDEVEVGQSVGLPVQLNVVDQGLEYDEENTWAVRVSRGGQKTSFLARNSELFYAKGGQKN